jgi:hypothetical protein
MSIPKGIIIIFYQEMDLWKCVCVCDISGTYQGQYE